jgi:hypothetical protein
MADSPADDIKDMSFEVALRELETIVGKLESGQAPLAESIAIYERCSRPPRCASKRSPCATGSRPAPSRSIRSNALQACVTATMPRSFAETAAL